MVAFSTKWIPHIFCCSVLFSYILASKGKAVICIFDYDIYIDNFISTPEHVLHVNAQIWSCALNYQFSINILILLLNQKIIFNSKGESQIKVK